MDKKYDLFRYSPPMDAAWIAVLRNLREQGLLCATHTLRQEGREIVALLQSEIAQLQNAGISVEVLDSVELDLSHGAPLADIATSFAIWRIEAAAKDPEGTLEGILCRLLCRTHPARHRERSHDLKTAISSRAEEDDECSFCMEISQKPTLIRK